MKTMGIQEIGTALGISEPWSIQSVKIDESEKTINVHLDIKNYKRKFKLFGSGKNHYAGALLDGSWQYLPIGLYATVIHAQIPQSSINNDEVLSQSLINQLGFLGHPERRYSNFIRQQFAILQAQGLDTSNLRKFYRIDSALADTISKDILNAPEKLKNLAYLPTENDPIWEQILLDKQLLRTSVLPLKFLLSKLKLNALKEAAKGDLSKQVEELRKFIVANIHLLDTEIDQLSGVTKQKKQAEAVAGKSKQKLVLPALKNPLWMDIISGKLKLNSQSLPLNLLISRQRKSFLDSTEKEDIVNLLSQLRKYFHKNYRTLKPELLLINRVMNTYGKDDATLPNPEHGVWKKILDNDNFLESDHMAYKLLLARLRSQLSSKVNPVIQLDAAKHIRDFMTKNQKVMHKELNFLLMQSNSGQID